MPDLTEADVREYLRQASEATPEPWSRRMLGDSLIWIEDERGNRVGPTLWHESDASFVVASRAMGPALAEAWLQQREEIERLRAVAEAARLLTLELNDWIIDRARDGWGNTNSNIVQRKRDALLTALEGGGQGG